MPLLLLTVGTVSRAYDFQVDGIYYTKNSDVGTVAVSIGRYYRGTYSGETITIPATVQYGESTYEVTEIGESAFFECSVNKVVLPNSITAISRSAFAYSTITEIALPGSVTSIHNDAFYGCANLEEVSFPEGIECIQGFSSCTNLKTVHLPSTATSIGERAFSSCTSLKTINLPSAVTSIDEDAFARCTSLELTLPSSVVAIGARALKGVPTIHISNYDAWMNIVTSTLVFGASSYTAPSTYNRGGYWFDGQWAHVYYNGNLLTEYQLPSGLTTINIGTFATNTDIESVVIPASVTTIGDIAFRGCTNLSSVTLSDAVTEIKARAFYGCSSLESITFGNSIASIGEEAFYSCNNISYVDIGDIANWCECDFYDDDNHSSRYNITSNPLWVAKRIYLKGTLLDELSIPSGVTKIKDFAFGKVQRFSKLTIPKTVKSIGRYAFLDCNDLEAITFAKNSQMESIGYSAFANCIGLTSVTLPNSITTLGGFDGCTNIESINVPTSATRLLTSTFSGLSKLTSITLPEGLLSIGKNAFNGCKLLTEINIPSTVRYIYYQAFQGCTGLQAVHITDVAGWCSILYGEYANDPTSAGSGMSWDVGENQSNPLSIARNLYLNGELVTDLVVPEGVTQINDYAFRKATCLTSVSLPEGMTSIGRYAFEFCVNIKGITIPATLTDVRHSAFRLGTYASDTSTPWYEYFKPNTDDPVRLDIKDLDKWIANSLGNGFSCSLGFDPYLNGTLVENIVLPSDMTEMFTVHDNAAGDGGIFAYWNIQSVTLPKGLDKLGSDAFFGCKKLKAIYCKGRFAPTLQYEVINSGYTNSVYTTTGLRGLSGSVIIYVPSGRKNNYTSNWAGNADIIQEVPENFSATGNISAMALRTKVEAYKNVYDKNVPYLDLTGATLDETVTGESLQDIADRGTIIFLPDGTLDITGTNIVANGRTQKLILRDSVDFAAPYDFIAEELEYQRSFTASNTEATTICLPYSISENPEGMKAYTLRGLDENGNAMFDETKIIEANKPYVVTITKNTVNLSGENVQVKATPTEMPDAGCDEFEFRGALTKISHEDAAYEELYVLSAEKQWQSVYNADDDVYVPAGRAYLVPTGTAPASFGTVLQTTSPDIPVYNLTIMASGGGCIRVGNEVVSGGTKQMPVDSNSTLTIEIEADEDYELENLFVDGVDVKALVSNNIYTVAQVQKDMTIEAVFHEIVEITIVDGTNYTNNRDKEYEKLHYSRTFKNTNWQAWYAPFDVKLTGDVTEHFAFAKFAGTYTEEDGTFYITVVRLKEGDVVKANTPYCVQAKVADNTNPQVITQAGVILREAEENSFYVLSAEKKITFWGNYTRRAVTEADQNVYAMSGGLYSKQKSGNTLASFRCFFTIEDREDNPYASTSNPAEVKLMMLGDDDETSLCEIHNSQSNGVAYDLGGRQVNQRNIKKGIYIIKGKKVFMK